MPGSASCSAANSSRAGHELVAVVAGQARRALADLGEQQVEVATGAAVAVAEDERALAVVVGRQLLADGGDDPLRPAVVRRRQVPDLDRVGRPSWREHSAQVAGERAAGDHERLRHGRISSGPTGPAARRPAATRRALTSSLAVSAATAASRQ